MTRFLVTQANSFYNKGEAAIGISIVRSIRSMYPDAQISFLTSDPAEAAKVLSRYGVKCYDRFLNMHGTKRLKGFKRVVNRGKLACKAVASIINPNTRLLGKQDKSVVELFRQSDVVIIGGGGMFGGNKYRSISSNLLPIYLAKKLGKKVMIFAPSVEPFTSMIVKYATKFAFNRADIITVREKYTLRLLQDLKIMKPIYLTADPAFLIEDEPVQTGAKLLSKAGMTMDKRLRIGMTVRDWDFPGEKDSNTKQRNYQEAIRTAIERLIRDTSAVIVLFTTSINAPYDDDRVFSEKIRQSLDADLRNSVVLLTEDYTPEETKAMIGNMDIFVASRTHSAIFSLTMNIPLVHIACEPNKNNGIIESFGLEKYVLKASELMTEELVHTTRRLISERNLVTQKIREEMQVVKSHSAENAKVLKALIDGTKYENPRSVNQKPADESVVRLLFSEKA